MPDSYPPQYREMVLAADTGTELLSNFPFEEALLET
jgi:hypothetical protein